MTPPVSHSVILSVLNLGADLLHQLLNLVVAEVDAVLLQHLLDAATQVRTLFGSKQDSGRSTYQCATQECV